jgi:hypothetical protein
MTTFAGPHVVRFFLLWVIAEVAVALAAPLVPTPWLRATFQTTLVALAQWLLLRDHVVWAARWALATFAGGVACAVLGLPDRSLVSPFGLTPAVVAVSQAVALWPSYRQRTLALVAGAVGIGVASQIVVRIVIFLSGVHGWRLALVIPAVAGALAEVGALLWLARDEATRPSIAAPIETAPSPARIALLLPVWLLGACVVVVGLVALRPATPGPTTTSVLTVMLGPYVVALVATAFASARPYALATLASGAGIVTLVGAPAATLLAPFILLGTMNHPERTSGALALLAVPAVNGLLLVAAVLAFWRTTRPAMRSTAAVTGLAVTLITIPLAGGSVTTLGVRENRERVAKLEASPAARFERAFDSLRSCLRRAAAAETPGPRTVDDLGPQGLACLDAARLRPVDGAYQVHVLTPPAGGPPAAFGVCITRPHDEYGFVARLVDERAHADSAGDGPSPPIACADASGDPMRNVRYCLWKWAGEHDGTYPDALEQLAEGGPGQCLPRMTLSDWRRDAHVTYIPGASTPTDWLSSFTLIESPRTPGRPGRSRRLDETGIVRATSEARLPTRRDPTDDAARAQQVTESDLDRSGVATWERKCAVERPEDCRRLARVLERRAERWQKMSMRFGSETAPAVPHSIDDRPLDAIDVARAAALYRTACHGGVAEACDDGRRLLLRRPAADGERDAEIVSLSNRGCALGSAASCDDAAARRGADGSLAPAPSALGACAAGARLACRTAGEIAAVPADALRLFERACDLGDAEGCLRASRLATLQDVERGRVLHALACSATPQPDGCDPPR